MELNGQELKEEASKTSKSLLIFLWIVSLAIFSGLSFFIGRNSFYPALNSYSTAPTPSSVLGAQNTNISPTPSVDLSGICKKSGASQKSEYLRAYIIQAGDSLQSIAEKELGDVTRVDEISKLNADASGLTAGSTVYLPPEGMKKTSGNLVQLSGMIVRQDNAVWQISYGGGVGGLGVAIPAYYFTDVANKSDFTLGDCVTIFMENGVKVFTLSRQ